MSGLTETESKEYRDSGFVVRPGRLSDAECDQFVEHMLDLHTGQLRRPDTDANAGKFVRPKGRDDRLKAVMTTCTTLFSYTHRTGRQVYIVGHYQDIFGT